jgi:hypothetical protein
VEEKIPGLAFGLPRLAAAVNFIVFNPSNRLPTRFVATNDKLPPTFWRVKFLSKTRNISFAQQSRECQNERVEPRA